MVCIKADDNNCEKVLLVFKKNRIGEYIYKFPACCKKMVLGFAQNYSVTRGIHKESRIRVDDCFECNGLISKVMSGKNTSLSLKVPKNFNDEGNYIALILDEDVEKYLYKNYREKTNKEISDEDFLLLLLAEGDRIGRSIEKIDKKTFGGYSVIINDKFNNLEIDNSVALLAFNNTPSNARAEASFGGSDKKNVRIPVYNGKLNDIGIDVDIDTLNAMYAKFKDEKPIVKNSPVSTSNKTIKKKERETIKPEDIGPIKEEIKKKIINQDRAIDSVLNNIYFNQRYIETGDKDLLRNKANILLDGSTGTGKTFIIEEVTNKLNLPVFITGITNYSSVGYKGADLVNVLAKLMEKADGDLELAERGIVAFDEFDKLGTSSDNDISMRKAIQQELLSFISGTRIDVDYKGRVYNFDTSKLTIIAVGAFTNLRERKIEENEKKANPTMGFVDNKKSNYERVYKIEKDDYVKEGLERELVGRFSCLTHTNDLSVDDLVDILNKSISSPINGLRVTGNIMGCNIIISPEIIHDIAQMGYDTNTGARGLIEIVQSLKDVIANDLFLGNKEIVVTKEHLEKTLNVHKRQYLERKGR